MNTKLILRWLRFEIHAAKRCLQILSERGSEIRWARDVHVTAKRHPGAWISYDPKPIYKLDAKTSKFPTDMSAACRATLQAVLANLECQPLPAGVSRLRSKERSK